MDFTTKIDHEDKLIKIVATCLLDQDIRKSILYSIVLEIKNSKYNKVLIDLTKASFKKDEPTAGALALTRFMNSIGMPPRARLAFVFLEAELHRKYFEEIATTSHIKNRILVQNRGGFKFQTNSVAVITTDGIAVTAIAGILDIGKYWGRPLYFYISQN